MGRGYRGGDRVTTPDGYQGTVQFYTRLHGGPWIVVVRIKDRAGDKHEARCLTAKAKISSLWMYREDELEPAVEIKKRR